MLIDCKSFYPYQVLQFPWAFEGDPGEVLKLWIVAYNDPKSESLICFKPTATLTRYLREPMLMLGAVEYSRGELGFFPERTIVGVDPWPVNYAHLRRCHLHSRVKVLGEMPADFPQKLRSAVNARPDWSNTKKKLMLQRYGLTA